MKWPEDFINKIICGDCLEVMKEMPNESTDLILADLPYGITGCKWDNQIHLNKMWERLKAIRKNETPIVLFGNEPFSSNLRMSNIDEFKYDWYCKKNYSTGIPLSKYQPMRCMEIISVFYETNKIFNKQLRSCSNTVKRRWKNGQSMKLSSQVSGSKEHLCSGKKHTVRYKVNPINFLEYKFPPRAKGTFHPTQKPIALMEYLIKTYTNENNLILDFTIRSGTTAIACKKLKRNFIGIEINPGYCKIAEERLAQGVL